MPIKNIKTFLQDKFGVDRMPNGYTYKAPVYNKYTYTPSTNTLPALIPYTTIPAFTKKQLDEFSKKEFNTRYLVELKENINRNGVYHTLDEDGLYHMPIHYVALYNKLNTTACGLNHYRNNTMFSRLVTCKRCIDNMSQVLKDRRNNANTFDKYLIELHAKANKKIENISSTSICNIPIDTSTDVACSHSVVRPSILDPRSKDSGSNPGESTTSGCEQDIALLF